MKTAIFYIFCLFTLTTFGQVDNNATFRKTDYPANKYSIKVDTFTFQKLKVELIQAKLIDYKNYEQNSAYCRIWLIVKNGEKIIDKLFFNDCEAVGGCSGIYKSSGQTRKDYLILSKFGDYDGQVLIIDSSGKIQSYFGGKYYISADNKFLFSTYDSDLAGLTVFDLSKNKVLFTSDSIGTYLADFYFYKNEYFAIVSDDVRKLNERDIVTFNFMTNELIKSTVDDKFIENAEQLKSYNSFTIEPCNCGQTKK